jgi:pimeloyl-ACP methyl ester carboxylesterase
MRSKRTQCGELEVAYREWSPVGGYNPRMGLPVVCVHGNWATSAVWTKVAAEAPERCLFAPDLRGRGRTRGPDNSYGVDELAIDLHAFLDALEFERAHLVGHSLGAGVITEFALRWPARVASLLLLAPVWVDGMPEQHHDTELAQLMHRDRNAFAKIYAAMAPTAKRDVLWAGLVETGQEQRLEASLRNLDALCRWQPGDRLRELAMPRRVVVGQQDQLTGGKVAARVAEVLGIEPISIPDIGHSPHLEAPVWVAEVLAELATEAERKRR